MNQLIIDATDITFKGFDITVYEIDHIQLNEIDFTVDVKKPCGELVAGWESVESFDEAMQKAKEFIKSIKPKGK